MKMINPYKEFAKTPEKFSDKSKILDLKKSDPRSGVVLDSPEEFAKALIVYGGGSVRGSRETQKVTLDVINEEKGPMAVGLVLLVGDMFDADAFTKKLAEKSIFSLKSTGHFYESFEYTFNNFQKTSITGKRVGEKYVLNLCAAYVLSDELENRLAKALDKPLALVGSNISAKLGVVDDWWFNFDFEDAIKGFPVSKKQIKGLTDYISSEGISGEKSNIEFEYKGKKIGLTLGLSADRHLRPENGDWKSRYMQARGNSIVGGAWTDRDERYKEVEPRVYAPSVVYSVHMLGESNFAPPAVTEEEMNTLQGARDHLSEIILSEHKVGVK